METRRLVAVLKVRKGATRVLERGDAMLQKLTGNALVGSTTPTLAAFKADLDALRAAQAARGNGPGAVAARDLALNQVRRDMENLRSGVQQSADASPAEAAAVIEGAGMYVKVAPVRSKPDLEIQQGSSSGTAIGRAKARGRGTTYWWQVSADQRTWLSNPPTRIAKDSFANLTPGTTYYFRFQTLTSAGMSDWSQIVSFMVK